MDESTETRVLTRGGLIKAGGLVALALGASGAGRVLADAHAADVEATGIKKPRGGPAHLRHVTYAPLVGSDFRLHLSEARAVRLKLIEARARRGPGEAFSLLFRGRRGVDVDGGTYRIDHPTLGGFELSVNPVDRGRKGLHLEAVVNRIAT